MKILVDMNLSVEWVAAFTRNGMQAAHWSSIGDPRASDQSIVAWASANSHVVFTHDLDFGTVLALTHAHGPSVVLLRTQDNLPERCEATVVDVLRVHEQALQDGAILVIDEHRSKIRLLPL
jgi:predicted nuclease of predicted toxin-antitoxin system